MIESNNQNVEDNNNAPRKADKTYTLMEARKKVEYFIKEREWEKYHNPKDIALAMSIEVGELLEHFRFKSIEEISDYLNDGSNKKEVSYEIADIFFFLLSLVNSIGLDLSEAFEDKLKISAEKYPVDIVKGKNHKYIHYK